MIADLDAAFEAVNGDYCQFDQVVNPPSRRSDLCAFLLLDKLQPWDDTIISNTGHHTFFLRIDCLKLASVATQEDILMLARCGVRYNRVYDCLEMQI